jgi:hypothetical protein
MVASPACPSLSGVSPGSLVHNYSAQLVHFRTSKEIKAFSLSGELVPNCFGHIARTSTDFLLVRLSPYGKDRFSDKRPSLGAKAAIGGMAA